MKTNKLISVIVAGSRDFNDYQLLKNVLDHYLSNYDRSNVTIISGTARGADRLGEQYARQRGMELSRFPANWKKYGKSAGFERNMRMSMFADVLVAFWDGQSRGTKHMIDTMQKAGKQAKVIHFCSQPVQSSEQLALGF
jgi:hypothetical protein